jgi:hypothetical protein
MNTGINGAETRKRMPTTQSTLNAIAANMIGKAAASAIAGI